ncbi:uncharacterized protein Z518_07180 [Rhinocladiella mackenziei CBS 650.93]|uniref:Uncharacterized protein n=1 Tax=Rhinocladiella mackenziei CBS 650.93 TaxID=1442369 RepID=A0A0D2FNJ4_9EURO|nr:uncharacterized protein Z518_07180 [Rhinocladiella mackenziei CBS 650.93]KIX03627.1 hypothetical protein Z518_07180 [Rhinocladiella mackenziei CBS 650.93]
MMDASQLDYCMTMICLISLLGGDVVMQKYTNLNFMCFVEAVLFDRPLDERNVLIDGRLDSATTLKILCNKLKQFSNRIKSCCFGLLEIKEDSDR